MLAEVIVGGKASVPTPRRSETSPTVAKMTGDVRRVERERPESRIPVRKLVFADPKMEEGFFGLVMVAEASRRMRRNKMAGLELRTSRELKRLCFGNFGVIFGPTVSSNYLSEINN